MNKLPTLYKKPFIVSAVFIIVAVSVIIFAAYVDLGDGSFALIALGIFILIIGIVTLCVYAMMEGRFRKVLDAGNGTLLRYQMNENELTFGVSAQADNVKSTNKSTLLIILFFCAVFAIGGPIFIEDDGYIFSIISIALGVFMTIMALIITKYRTNKLKKGLNREVILTVNAAYVFGELHTWRLPGFLLSVGYSPVGQNQSQYPNPNPSPNLNPSPNPNPSKIYNCDVINIEYTAVAWPIQLYNLTIPIPKGMEAIAQQAVSILGSSIVGRQTER